MIFVVRPSAPAVLTNNQKAWTKALLAARAKKDKALTRKIEGRYRHHAVKSKLTKMFGGKCAYCESILGVVDYGHIEHYKPKTKYPKLTFAWRNLLLSCAKCNDSGHKGQKFPTARVGGPIVDPTLDDPTNHFRFDYDASTRQAVIVPTTSRGSTSVSLLDLNGPTRKELVRERSKFIRGLLLAKQYEHADPEAAAILAEARSPESQYSAWVAALGL